MWTFNGTKTLEPVLKQINHVIPDSIVNQRLIIDDGSTDKTVEIAKACGWNVIHNEGKGISDGANTALKHVETGQFASFEQDLLLSPEWLCKIQPLLKDNVVVASGIRLANNPSYLFTLEKYSALRPKKNFFFGRSMDNTLYDTSFLNEIGGFPKLTINAGVDNVLAEKVFCSGKRWLVDFNVVSSHLRSGLVDEIKHYYWYGTCIKSLKKTLGNHVDSYQNIFVRTCFSPVRGIQMAYETWCWQLAFVYPILRLSYLTGATKSYLEA
jgi:glycosyltransferase involved in cell wall biosynthesis